VPPRPRTSSVDLTSQNRGVNPSQLIHDNYKNLMAIPDLDQLKQAVIGLVQPTVNHGFSPKNYQTFLRNLEQATQRGLEGVQFFLSNFMLKGAGLGVSESSMDAIASMICEDTLASIPLTNEQRRLKLLVESYGYSVCLLSVQD